jgi:hypothetical protein
VRGEDNNGIDASHTQREQINTNELLDDLQKNKEKGAVE